MTDIAFKREIKKVADIQNVEKIQFDFECDDKRVEIDSGRIIVVNSPENEGIGIGGFLNFGKCRWNLMYEKENHTIVAKIEIKVNKEYLPKLEPRMYLTKEYIAEEIEPVKVLPSNERYTVKGIAYKILRKQ